MSSLSAGGRGFEEDGAVNEIEHSCCIE